MKGMATCKVCGRDFALMVEERYTAVDAHKIGAFAALVSTDKDTQYDAFDCPHCGCQNVMQERKHTEFDKGNSSCDYFVNCEECKHDDCDEDDEPCASCKHAHRSYFEKRDNNE